MKGVWESNFRKQINLIKQNERIKDFIDQFR